MDIYSTKMLQLRCVDSGLNIILKIIATKGGSKCQVQFQVVQGKE